MALSMVSREADNQTELDTQEAPTLDYQAYRDQMQDQVVTDLYAMTRYVEYLALRLETCSETEQSMVRDMAEHAGKFPASLDFDGNIDEYTPR